MPLQSLDQKSDAWLIAALQSKDVHDREAAAAFIFDTHEPQLRAYMRAKLPVAWAEDALSETWKGFLTAIERQGVRTSIGQLLGGIAEHKRADAVDRKTRERRFEADMPPTLRGKSSVADEIEAKELGSFLESLPYGNSILTPCERILWMLEKQYQYPRELIGRILDKKRNTLEQHFSNAEAKVAMAVHSEEYQAHEWKDNPFPNHDPVLTEDAVIIENFSSWFLPRLTEEEIAPLGIAKEELSEHYSALLMVPRWKANEGNNTEYGKLDLLLVRNEDHKRWYQEVTRIQRRPHGKTFRFPDACLVALNVDNDNLKLEVMSLIEIWPDLDTPEHSDNTWVSMHNVPVVVPVMYSPLDEEMYDDPEIFNGGTAWDMWPFLTT